MLSIVPSTRFRRDYKRVSRGPHNLSPLRRIVESLAKEEPLPPSDRDHKLQGGDYRGCRDCHVHGDLVLIYRIRDARLELVRIGSHAELGIE
jgi:mRNA interferase YafQ